MTRIAIIAGHSINQLEPFIRTDIDNIDGIISYYHSDGTSAMPRYLETQGLIAKTWQLGFYELLRLCNITTLSCRENALLRSFRSQKIGVVLAEYGPTGVCVLPVCKKMNIPLIVHFRGFDAYDRSTVKRFYDGYQQLFKYAFKIMVVSRAMRNRLIELGCGEKKLVFNPSTPQLLFYENDPSYENQTLVAVGELNDRKAPYYLILSFATVLKKFPDAQLNIIGDGVLHNACVNLIRALGIDRNVKLLGRKTSCEIASYLNDARAFVQHSITPLNQEKEGTPTAIMEAGAARLPVISTRHAGIPEAVIDGETGLLVDEHDVDGMTLCMSCILEDKALAMRLGEKGRQRIEKHYGMDKHISIINEMICNACQKR